jgi:hypothetical protein
MYQYEPNYRFSTRFIRSKAQTGAAPLNSTTGLVPSDVNSDTALLNHGRHQNTEQKGSLHI